MASATTASPLSYSQLEDVLAHLPISTVTEYKKGETIYSPDHPSTGIFLVVSGKVAISQLSSKGKELLMEIIRPEELFSESAFLDVSCRSEQATAFEKASVMTWTISEVEDLVMRRPRLAMALLQILAQRNIEFVRRIESFSTESIDRRLARALIRFSERLGTGKTDGSVKMMAVTHELLARYVGTSREIITHHMNQLRKQGCVSYSRRGIVVYRNAIDMSMN